MTLPIQVSDKEWSEWLQMPQTKLLFKLVDELIKQEADTLGAYAYNQKLPDLNMIARSQGFCIALRGILEMDLQTIKEFYKEEGEDE